MTPNGAHHDEHVGKSEGAIARLDITAKRFLQEFKVATDELESLTEEHDRIISRLMSMGYTNGNPLAFI